MQQIYDDVFKALESMFAILQNKTHNLIQADLLFKELRNIVTAENFNIPIQCFGLTKFV